MITNRQFRSLSTILALAIQGIMTRSFSPTFIDLALVVATGGQEEWRKNALPAVKAVEQVGLDVVVGKTGLDGGFGYPFQHTFVPAEMGRH